MVGLSSSSFFLSKIFDSVSSLKQSFSGNGSDVDPLKSKNETTLHPSWFWLTVLLVSTAMPTTTKDLVPAFGMKETKTAGKSKSDNRLGAGSGNSRGGQAMDFRHPSSSFRGDLFTHQDPDNLPKRIGAKLNVPQQHYVHPEPLPHARNSLGDASFHPNLGSHAPHSKPFPDFEHLELPIPNLVPGEIPVVLPVQAAVTNPVAAPVQAAVTNPVAAPVQAAVTNPVAAPIQAAVANPVAAPIQAAVANPVAAPIQAAVANPAAAPIQAAVANPVAAPVTIPATGLTLVPGTTTAPVAFTITGKPMGIAIKATPPHVTHIAGTAPVQFQVQQQNMSFQYPFRSYLGPRSQDLKDRLEVVLEEINEIVTLNPKRSQDLKDRLEVVLDEINEIVTLVPRPTLRATGKQMVAATIPELDVSNLKLFMDRIEPEGAALAKLHIPTVKTLSSALKQAPAVGTQLQQPAERIAESIEPKLEQNLHFGKPIKDLAKKPSNVKDSPFQNQTRRNLFPDLKVVKDFPKLDIVEEFLEPVNVTFFPSSTSKKFTQSSKVHDLKLPPLEIETSETVTRQTINLIDQLKLELNEETILPTISLPMLKKPGPKYNYDDLFNEFNEPTVYPDIVETIEIPDLQIPGLAFHGGLKALHDDRDNPITFHNFERDQTAETIDLVEPLHMVTNETINLIEQLKVEVNESIYKPLIHRRPLYPARNVLAQEEHTFSSLVADRTTNLLSSAASVFDALTDMFTFASLGSSISQASKTDKELDLKKLASEVDEEIVPQKYTDEEQRIFAHEQDILSGIKGKQAAVSDLSTENKDWLSSTKSAGRLNYKIKPITIMDLSDLSTTTETIGASESYGLEKDSERSELDPIFKVDLPSTIGIEVVNADILDKTRTNALKQAIADSEGLHIDEVDSSLDYDGLLNYGLKYVPDLKSRLATLGVNLDDLRKDKSLKTVVSDVKPADIDKTPMKDLGPTPQDLLNMGEPYENILRAGYTLDELLKANFVPALRPTELENAGYVLTTDILRDFVRANNHNKLSDSQINQLSDEEERKELWLPPISKEGATPSVSASVTMAQTLDELIDTVAFDKLKVALSDATGMAKDAFDNFGEDTLRTMAKTLPDMDLHLANAGAPLIAPSAGLKTVVSDEDFATFDDPADLLAYGEYTREAIAQANYGFDRLADAGFTAQELANAGATAQDLKDAGFIASDLTTIYSLADLADAGYDLAALIAAGFSGEELESESYLHDDILAHGGVFAGASVVSSVPKDEITQLRELLAKGDPDSFFLDSSLYDEADIRKEAADAGIVIPAATTGTAVGVTVMDEMAQLRQQLATQFSNNDYLSVDKFSDEDIRDQADIFGMSIHTVSTPVVDELAQLRQLLATQFSNNDYLSVDKFSDEDIRDQADIFGMSIHTVSTPVAPTGPSVPTTATGVPPVDDLDALLITMGSPVTPTFNSLQDVEKWAMKSQENFSKVYGLTGALTGYARVFDDYTDTSKDSKDRVREEQSLRFALKHIENQFGAPIALEVLNDNLLGKTFAKLSPEHQAEFIRNHKDYKDHIWDFYGAVLGKDTSPQMTQLIIDEVDKLFGKGEGTSLLQARQNQFPMESRTANVKALNKFEKKLTDAERDEVEIYLNAMNHSTSSDEIKGFMDMIKGTLGDNRGNELESLLNKQFADLKGKYILGGETGKNYFIYDIDENNGVAAGIPHPKNPKLRILELNDEMVAGLQAGDNLTVATTLGEVPEDDFIRQIIAAPSKPMDKEPEVISKKTTSAPSISTRAAVPDLSDEGLKLEKAKGKASLDEHLQKEKNPEHKKTLKGVFENAEYLYKQALKGNVEEARKILAHVESVPGLGIDAAEYLFDSFVLDGARKLPEAQRSAYIQQAYEEEYLQNKNASVLANVIMGKVRTLFGEDAGDKLAHTYKTSLISQASKDFEAKDTAGKKSSVTAMPAPTEKLKPKKGKKQPLPVSKKEDKDL